MKKLLIFFVLLSSISSFGQVQRPNVMKREINPTANGLFYWDDASKRAVTSTKFTFIPSSSYFLQSYLTNGKFERGFTTVTGKPYFNYTDNSNNNCLALDSMNNLTIGNQTVAGKLIINGGTNPPFLIFPAGTATIFKVNNLNNFLYFSFLGTNMYIMKRSQFYFGSYNEPKYFYVQSQLTDLDGIALNIAAGGTYASRSNGNGGILYLRGGTTNNAGYSSVRLQRYSRTSTSGTTANTARDAFVVPSDKPLSNNTATTLFTIPFPDDSATYGNSVSGKICYAISVRGTDGVQSMSGVITFAGVEYLGTVTTNIAADISRTALSSSTLTLTPTLTYAAGVWTVQVNSNSGLTTPVTKITYSVELGNNGASITQN